MKPNLFRFATSELSQDAFLCWFVSWADDKYTEDFELKTCAKNFISMLLEKLSLKEKYSQEIKKVNVWKQWENIDIWFEVNDDVAIIIEDKTDTSEHSNQLERYKELAEGHYAGQRKLVFIYLKTGNFSLHTIPNDETNYKLIDRQSLLSILNMYNGNNQIINDFKSHLTELEEITNSFLNLPVSDWEYRAWQGFYRAIQERYKLSSNSSFDNYEWAYVPNQSGGFFGMWGHFHWFDDGTALYLQFEQGDLAIKIGKVEDNRSEIRNMWHETVMKMAEELGLTEVCKPSRFGNGSYMTVAKIDASAFFGENVIVLDDVYEKIKKYEELIDKCAEKYKD